MTRSRSLAAIAAALTLAPLAGAVAPTVAAAQSRTAADPQAEAFVQREANVALGILNNRSDMAARRQAFRAFVDRVADVPRITDFVLGQYRRTITPQQRQAFAAAFRGYANSVYESRLGEYSGQTLKVTGSVQRKPGDAVVFTQVTGGGKAPVAVNWRVLQEAGGQRVVDVQVAGVWLAITEQQDFTATLANHNGDINVLTAQLNQQARSRRP